MVRFSEMVLAGHPDKLCDQIADEILMQAYRADRQAYCQVEVACWADEFFLTGCTVSRRPMEEPLENIVRRVGEAVGYRTGNAVDAARWSVRNLVCQEVTDPRRWTEHSNDQCIVIGYAGYDAKTGYQTPEHHLAHRFREALTLSCRSGRLLGQGPDGKLIVRIREESSQWILEHILVTMQQLGSDAFPHVVGWVAAELRDAYREARGADSRWAKDWEEVEVLVNPNGPLVNGGPDGDNGQTGRKLVMDYYGPRVPIGGGALSGKDVTHVDRAGAYAARQAAVTALASGAKECLVRVAYAPNIDDPLDTSYEGSGSAPRLPASWFSHRSIGRRLTGSDLPEGIGAGNHFSGDAVWNRPVQPVPRH